MSAMKYTIPIVALMILGALWAGQGYLKTRRIEQNTVSLRTQLSAMSIQELSRRSEKCDQSTGGRPLVGHDADYCAEVWREIEARPLQSVEMPKQTDRTL
jgi:hypothetical protein